MKKRGYLWWVGLYFAALLSGCSDVFQSREISEEKTVADSFDSVNLVGKHSSVSESGVLNVDAKGAKGFLRAAQTPIGLFEGGKDYFIKFKCRIDSLYRAQRFSWALA